MVKRLFAALSVFATLSALAATYKVETDKPGCVYRCGETATFTVTVLDTANLCSDAAKQEVTLDSYCVNYSVGDSPFGPFEFKGRVLSSQRPLATGAGHHSVLNIPGTDEWYICYHRRPIPSLSPNHRVTCLDRMYFDEKGDIKPVVMTK